MRKVVCFFSFLLVLAGALSFSSCEYEKDEEKIPEANLGVKGFFEYLANGETLSIDAIYIDEEKSSEGVHIELVEYYLDGEKIASTASSPFGFSYLLQDQSVGEHELKVCVEVSGEGYVNTKYMINLKIHILEKPFSLSFDWYFDNGYVADKPTVSNGETLSGHIELAESNTIDATIIKVEYYWDDKLFGASSFAPFSFNYAVKDEAIGNHTFKSVVTTSTDYGEFTITGVRTVVVK